MSGLKDLSLVAQVPDYLISGMAWGERWVTTFESTCSGIYIPYPQQLNMLLVDGINAGQNAMAYHNSRDNESIYETLMQERNCEAGDGSL